MKIGTASRPRGLAGLVLFAACAVSASAHAQAYRCDDGGRITYTNLPCPSGKQTEITAPVGPTAGERATAESRNRADQAKLKALDRQHADDRRQQAKDAKLAAKSDARRGKSTAACAKLAVRVRRAHEDYETAGPREQATRRTRWRRAEEDYAAQCGKR